MARSAAQKDNLLRARLKKNRRVVSGGAARSVGKKELGITPTSKGLGDRAFADRQEQLSLLPTSIVINKKSKERVRGGRSSDTRSAQDPVYLGHRTRPYEASARAADNARVCMLKPRATAAM